MVNEEKELFKFVNNPKYRAKVIDRIHKERDREHEKKVKTVEKELDKLIKVRTDEIKKIANARWEKVAGGGLEINRTEGKVRINGSEHLFSNIQGSELNMLSGFRVVTKEQSHSKSKKSEPLMQNIQNTAVCQDCIFYRKVTTACSNGAWSSDK